MLVAVRLNTHGMLLLLLLLACQSTPLATPGANRPREAQQIAPAPASAQQAPVTTPPEPSTKAPPQVQHAPDSKLSASHPLRSLDLSTLSEPIEAAIKAGKLPGCVVVVGRSDGVLFEKAYGQRALLPAPEAMTIDTIFDLASLTKPIATASAVLLLAEQGKLDVDRRVSRYLPGFARGGKGGITIRQLLVHGSGLPRVNKLKEYEAGAEAAMGAILSTRPLARPGAQYLYSDLGYLVLGKLVEQVSGQSFASFVRERLLSPLAMADTDFGVAAGKRQRAAPTELRDDKWIRGDVHDPRAYRLGGAAGNAGLFSTGADLARFARMLLSQGQLDGTQVLDGPSLFEMGRAQPIGDAVRTSGWDMHSDYSSIRGDGMSERAFGHGGFTGTSMWIDPGRDLFVVFLSNRVHPEGKGNTIRLAGQVASLAAAAIDRRDRLEDCDLPPGQVQPGIDTLRSKGFASLRGKRVGLIVNRASLSRSGERSIDLLHGAQGVNLVRLFSPEHGLTASREGHVAQGSDPATGLAVHSLFGKTRKPTGAMLDGLDTLVFDLQDVGVRFFTYMSTLVQVMEAAAEAGLEVVVLDRPNPLGGLAVQGPVLSQDRKTFVNYHPLPVRHGMSAGELASLLRQERGLDVRLRVVPMGNYRRDYLFADTGLAWQAPSPNLRSMDSVVGYPALGLLESTNISVGRGTKLAFQAIGAPWLKPRALQAELDRAGLLAVATEPTRLRPSSGPHRGRSMAALRLRITNPRRFQPIPTALALMGALQRVHGDDFAREDLQKMVGHKALLEALARQESVVGLRGTYEPELREFLVRRAAHLRYPTCGEMD